MPVRQFPQYSKTLGVLLGGRRAYAHVAPTRKMDFFCFSFSSSSSLVVVASSRLSLDLVLRGQQTQLRIIACFANFESSRQFSLFIIVSIFSISEKKSLDSRDYLNFAAFSDEANFKYSKWKCTFERQLHRCYKNRLQVDCTRVVRLQMEPLPEGWNICRECLGAVLHDITV